ncbi:MAG: oligosaccharide flippase family protein [Romboutsia timonensis]|uniref:lipopolysaccharide biosynthesis protein n=1 Tax=Romboutsia timonensis TaxID=1776391 RepID=UPI002A74CBA3|nr:oligosaccharide flippase family protein [Romboutsia timonensis]MDY2884035.1 oligosaccharide flippase family protein [Romboutsia timonensis]
MSTTNVAENAKRNIIWGILNKITTLILPFILRTFMIQYLGAEYLGLNGLFTSILQVLSLAELGFGEAMIFSMYEPIAKNHNNEICALLNLYKKIYRAIGTIVLFVGLIILPNLKHFINGEAPADINIYAIYIIYLINTVSSYFLFAYKESLLVAHQRSDIKSNISTVINVSMYMVQIIILITIRNYYYYVIFMPIFTILNNIVTHIVTKNMYPQCFCSGKIDKIEIKNIQKRVTGLFLYKICSVFRNSFDSIIISSFIGLVALAQYQNYYYIINSIIGILSVFTSSITAGVGNNIIKKSIEKNYNDYTNLSMMFMWIVGWCTVCLYCLYQPFMKIWVGTDLMLSEEIMISFCMYFFVLKAGDMCYVYRQAAGLWWQDKFRPVIEAVVNLSLNIILVKNFGIVGVLFSTIISLLAINFVWGAKILFKNYFKLSTKEYFTSMLYYSAVTLVNCIITHSLCELMNIHGYIDLIVRGIICVIIPNIIFILFYFKLPYFNRTKIFIKRILRIS